MSTNEDGSIGVQSIGELREDLDILVSNTPSITATPKAPTIVVGGVVIDVVDTRMVHSHVGGIGEGSIGEIEIAGNQDDSYTYQTTPAMIMFAKPPEILAGVLVNVPLAHAMAMHVFLPELDVKVRKVKHMGICS